MKIFKKTIEAFGGCALYLDKKMLKHLKIRPKDEVVIELTDQGLLISKPKISIDDIQELLNANK